MSESPQDQGDYTRYFAPNEVLLHTIIPDPSMLVKDDGLDSQAFIERLQENQIIQTSPLLSNALETAHEKGARILTFHRPADVRFSEPTESVKKQEVKPRDIGGITLTEHCYERDERRIIQFDERTLPLVAIVALTVDEIDDVKLIEHLMELDAQIAINKVTRLPVECGQYNRDAEDGTMPLVRSFAPNWSLAGYPGQIPGGGPAGIAVPFNGPAPTGFRLTGASSLPLLGQQATHDVDVYILDTIPNQTAIDGALGIGPMAARAGAAPANPFVQTLLGNGPAARGGGPLLSRTYAKPNVLPPLHSAPANSGVALACRDENMSDHGTFIAGIIHSIAPGARLHLVQILNDEGVGNALTLLGGLALALAPNPQRPNTPIVVNCSFGFQSPRPTDIVNLKHVNWPTALALIALSNDPVFETYVLGTMVSCEDLFTDVKLSLSQKTGAMTSSAGARIVVAAAGNDWHDICNPQVRATNRPEPRYPAYSDFVVGVGALTQSGAATQYSNIADEPSPTGVWTFGGDIDSTTARTNSGNHASIVGMYINPAFPDGRPNTSQWACWAGTSFSTAIASGVIANTLGQGGTLRDVFTAATPPTGGPRVLPVVQVP